MAELSPPHALSNAGSLLEHRRISAVAKPQLYAIELLVRLPLLAVIPAHQSDLLGLDYNGLATAHTDACRTVKKYKSVESPLFCWPKALQPKPQCPLGRP